ncbi:MAG: helix-turn-helix transcriptional regulator [Ruminococcus sp.]|nr:helix-turn-helix transcriptional regulator [Ruminococcus sp.]
MENKADRKVISLSEATARLKDLRKRAGITQREVERATGIRQPNLSAIESGKRDISLSDTIILAQLYGADPREVFCDPYDDPLPEKTDVSRTEQLFKMALALAEPLDDDERLIADTFLKLSAYIALRELYLSNPRHKNTRLFKKDKSNAYNTLDAVTEELKAELYQKLSRKPAKAKKIEPDERYAALLRELVKDAEEAIL